MTAGFIKGVLQEMLDTVNTWPDGDPYSIIAVDIGAVCRPYIQVTDSPAKYALPGEQVETRAVPDYHGDVVQIVERGHFDILRYISSPAHGEAAT